MPTKSTKTRNEAGTTTAVPLDQLRLFKRNPRKGNVGAVAASLKAHGQYRPIVVNIGTHTGRANEVLAGNHTLKAFRALAQKNPDDERWATIAVFWVDYDEDQALKVVLVDNKAREGGGYDSGELTGLLSDVRDSLDGFGATGFSVSDLDGLTPAPPTDHSGADEITEAELDAEIEEQTSGRGQAVISYSIVFDDQDQRRRWIEFVSWLKRRDPDGTPGERLTGYLEDRASAALQETEEA